MNINVSDKLIYFGAGCGLGLIVGALFAPKAGYETRNDISTRVDDLTQKVQEKIQSSGLRETATETWENVKQKGRNVVNIGKQRLNESIEEGTTRFSESLEDDTIAER
jgi:gas vesicle protein